LARIDTPGTECEIAAVFIPPRAEDETQGFEEAQAAFTELRVRTAMLDVAAEVAASAARLLQQYGCTGVGARREPAGQFQIHDLVLAKLAAGRTHDLEFAAEAIRGGLVDRGQLVVGLELMPNRPGTMPGLSRRQQAARAVLLAAIARPRSRLKPVLRPQL
jgi:hypothetical protein